MKKDFYPDRTICNLQLELKSNYKKLNEVLKDYSVINNIDIHELIKEMYCISKSIHYKATRMEKRLIKYKNSIEKLGFKRIRK